MFKQTLAASSCPQAFTFSPTVLTANTPEIAIHAPLRNSWMLDFSPSELRRLRFQWNRDQTRPDILDNQIFQQYNLSLGAHVAHAF